MTARRRRKTTKGAADAPVTTGGALAPLGGGWQDRLAKYVEDQSATAESFVGGEWPYLSLEGGMLSSGDDELQTPLELIVLDFAAENQYFATKYDPNRPAQAPDCYALHRHREQLAPPADLAGRQSDRCATCPKHQFGSEGDGSNRKACMNKIRLVVLPADDLTPRGIERAAGARLRVPTMSCPLFGAYANKITKGLHRPLWTVVSLLDVVPDKRTQFKTTFELARSVPLEDDVLEALEVRAKEAAAALFEVPPPRAESDAPATGRRRRVTRKVAKKPAAKKATKKTAKKGGVRRKF